jgi:hypothetical protein
MLKMANWFKKGVIAEANIAFSTNNIKKLDDLRLMGHDISELLNFEEHPLIVSIKEKKILLIIYFLKLEITSKLLEEVLILVKQEDLKDIEELIILQTQKKDKRQKFYIKKYEKLKKEENFILKNNI